MNNKDVFISYKKTFNELETEDAFIAKRLADSLLSKGIGVFFSEKTLFEQGYSKYKKAIDAALDTAKILVVIGTKKEYIFSEWLEYEYETFNRAIFNKKKPNGEIISYITGFKNADLPNTLGLYQSFYIDDTSVEKLTGFICNALNNSSNIQPVSNSNLKSGTDQKSGTDRLVVGGTDYSIKHSRSTYVSDYFNEIERLKIQAENSRESDRIAIEYMFEHCKWGEDEPLYIIDMGSAYGYVIADRFANNPRVKKILCIDNNSRVIERARIMFADNEKMVFEVSDVEDANFVNAIENIMRKHDIPRVHIVFSSLLINHLNYPKKALRKFRSLMSDNSYIILRGSDDGSKLCYPRPELMQEIIRKGIEESGLSDRHNGSKLFSQLTDSGFRNIRIFSYMTDLSGLSFEEKEVLFKESFSYRLDPYKLKLSKSPNDPVAIQKYEWMADALTQFEGQFFEPDFWYCEYDYVAVATKS